MATGQPWASPKATTSSGERDDLRGARARPATSALWAAMRELILSPMTSMAAGGGPIQVTPGGGDGPGEVGVLGEEPVARVDPVGAERGLTSRILPVFR